jgi:hypothetical protein
LSPVCQTDEEGHFFVFVARFHGSSVLPSGRCEFSQHSLVTQLLETTESAVLWAFWINLSGALAILDSRFLDFRVFRAGPI